MIPACLIHVKGLFCIDIQQRIDWINKVYFKTVLSNWILTINKQTPDFHASNYLSNPDNIGYVNLYFE